MRKLLSISIIIIISIVLVACSASKNVNSPLNPDAYNYNNLELIFFSIDSNANSMILFSKQLGEDVLTVNNN